MPRKFGPKTKEAAQRDDMEGRKCPGCGQKFSEGDFTTLVGIGPGDDEDERALCREGRPYNAVAIEAHYACVTGIVD